MPSLLKRLGQMPPECHAESIGPRLVLSLAAYVTTCSGLSSANAAAAFCCSEPYSPLNGIGPKKAHADLLAESDRPSAPCARNLSVQPVRTAPGPLPTSTALWLDNPARGR
jgi:hypothetical protein